VGEPRSGVADGQVRRRGRGWGWRVVGLVAVLAGMAGLATLTYWYGTDMGWTGSGSVLIVSRTPIVLAALVSVTAVLVGVGTMFMGPGLDWRSLKGVYLVGTTLLVVASVVVAVAAYPQVRHAELIAHGEDRWRTTVPVTEVFGVRDLTAATVTIEGRADRRECRWELRSVTIDRTTGAILELERLPSAYADESEIPTEPDPVDPALFEVAQGSAPFICQS
jgi:hypothetical protein